MKTISLKDDVIERDTFQTMNKLIDDENVDDTFNMKKCNEMITETNDKKLNCTKMMYGVRYC